MHDETPLEQIARLTRELAAARAQVDIEGRVRRVHELADRQLELRAQQEALADERNELVYELYELTDLTLEGVAALLGMSATRVNQLVAAARAARKGVANG